MLLITHKKLIQLKIIIFSIWDKIVTNKKIFQIYLFQTFFFTYSTESYFSIWDKIVTNSLACFGEKV